MHNTVFTINMRLFHDLYLFIYQKKTENFPRQVHYYIYYSYEINYYVTMSQLNCLKKQ